tara:strand:+ start:183 stop:437 length:255 start_codon:yes stop_codon:yes gene_type:complete
MLKIDKGIPIPKRPGRRANQELTDTLSLMEIGDSVEFPVDALTSNGAICSKKGKALNQLARKQGMKMTQRSNRDKNTIRYWRVK